MIEGSLQEISFGKGRICRDVLDDLPGWFGIPESVDAYVRDVENLPMFGFTLHDQIVGFISLKMHNRFVAEAYLLGVKHAWHRRGLGRMLFEHADKTLRRQGLVYLTVKTVAAERPNEEYAQTRRFYDALGFLPVEVFPTLWGPENPCLLMIKPLE
jgi:ribosomal protein S18 acetylase RimI-like enzyme